MEKSLCLHFLLLLKHCIYINTFSSCRRTFATLPFFITMIQCNLFAMQKVLCNHNLLYTSFIWHLIGYWGTNMAQNSPLHSVNFKMFKS